ncbi:unnamed protein product [Vitrella brassicaformis CCMP3155]|uniref:Uncharacterized protein n=2 Tax=Vitrella brassicaformis TaxID=1169539 RepID=A0A0G4EU22_VITBC|nr:unnamed protein product [Vitrella brassicaformis CCMP3155]|eukprot:CEM01573.1 unnamed protein product [Vitrella brassicaformis CCMP3155]
MIRREDSDSSDDSDAPFFWRVIGRQRDDSSEEEDVPVRCPLSHSEVAEVEGAGGDAAKGGSSPELDGGGGEDEDGRSAGPRDRRQYLPSITEWNKERKQLALQEYVCAQDVRRHLAQPKLLDAALGEDLLREDEDLTAARRQWESHLWGQISCLKEQVGGLIDRWTVEEQQQREQLKHTTEQSLATFKEVARQEFDILAKEEAALSAGLKDLSRRVHSWTDGPPTPHSSRPRPSRPASARVRGSSLSHRNSGDLGPSQGTLTSTAARLRLWREQSEHPRSRGRRKALSIKDQLEQALACLEGVKEELRGVDKEIETKGGILGGWREDDHQIFLKVKTACRDHIHTQSFMDRLLLSLPSRTREEAAAHIEWYDHFAILQAERRLLIQKWRSLKQQIHRHQSRLQHSEEAKDPLLDDMHLTPAEERYRREKQEERESRQQEAKRRRVQEWRHMKNTEEAQRREEEEKRRKEEQRRHKLRSRREAEERRVLLRAIYHHKQQQQYIQQLADAAKATMRPTLTAEDRQRLRDREQQLFERRLRDVEELRRRSQSQAASPHQGRSVSARYAHIDARLLDDTESHASRLVTIQIEREERMGMRPSAHTATIAGSFGHRLPETTRRVRATPSWRNVAAAANSMQ